MNVGDKIVFRTPGHYLCDGVRKDRRGVFTDVYGIIDRFITDGTAKIVQVEVWLYLKLSDKKVTLGSKMETWNFELSDVMPYFISLEKKHRQK